MAGLCEGRVAIVTGGGRGIGREYCLMLADEGAKVVVNDLGGARDGIGADAGPGPRGGRRDQGHGRRGGGQRRRRFRLGAGQGDDRPGGLRRSASSTSLINNAGILRDRMLVNMTEAEWDAVIKVHLKGTFAPGPPRGRLLARPQQGHRRAGRRADHQHLVGVRHLRQHRPDQLWRGQDGHRRLHHHRLARAAPLRGDGERHRARRADPADRGPGRAGHRGAARARRSRAGSRPSPSGWPASSRPRSAGGCSRPAAGCWPSPRAGTAARRAKPVQDPTTARPDRRRA